MGEVIRLLVHQIHLMCPYIFTNYLNFSYELPRSHDAFEYKPLKIKEEISTTVSLLPSKSRERYEVVYKKFMDWRLTHYVTSFSENVILAYFQELSNERKPSSLWSIYSMLRTTILINHEINIAAYSELISFLKMKSDGFKSKKSKILDSYEIDYFLQYAPEDEYLFMKVVLIIAISGACSKQELRNIKLKHVEDTGKSLMFTIPGSRKKMRSFVISEAFYPTCKKYMGLRPPGQNHRYLPFFLNYKNKRILVTKEANDIEEYVIEIFPALSDPRETQRVISNMITHKNIPKQTRECRPSFCNVCQIFFADPVIHATHSLTHSKGIFECAHCPAIAKMTEEQVEAHVRIHMNDPKYTCKKCGAKLYNDSTATKHEKIHFGSKKPLQCGLCDATFLFPCTLSAHEKTEHGDVIDVYRKENKARQEEDIKKKKVVKDHLPYANKPLDPVLCQYCNDTFGSNINYGHHLIKFHSLDEKFKCFLCKSPARMDEAGMEKHLRRHEFAQTYKCSVCNEGFCQRQDAEDHERFHRNATVECSDCDSQFLFVRCLFSHLKNVHSIQAKGTKCSSCDQSHKEISSSPVDCEICNKTLPNARALQSHEKMHFPKGKLSCELCYQSFRSVEMLVKHVMLHDADDLLEGLIDCGLEVEK